MLLDIELGRIYCSGLSKRQRNYTPQQPSALPLHIPRLAAYAACAPNTRVASRSTLARTAMPLQRCTAMSISSRSRSMALVERDAPCCVSLTRALFLQYNALAEMEIAVLSRTVPPHEDRFSTSVCHCL